MTDALPRPAVHRSVLVRLVLVILVMALCLMGLVIGFFFHFVNPTLSAAVERALGDDARRIATSAPGLEEARRLASQLDLQIRYEGPGGAWSTDPGLPTIAEAQAAAKSSDFTVAYSRHLVNAPNGGRYLFVWEFGRRTRTAHDRMLLLLLSLMLAVFVAAHVVIRRALRPLRALQDGVARMSAGDLDVSLPNLTRDEFGALTDAFNGMAARVKQMVVSRDQLLLDVSHELRSPLTRLKVALALLPDSAKKAQAESDVAEMDAMIGELLEFERLREGRLRPLTRVDLGQVLQDAARPWQEGPPGVRVLVSPPEIPVEVDLDGVRTVLRNLLGNAVKYSLPDSRPVELSLTRTESELVLRVVDDGSGVPEPDLPRVFEPFFRVDRSRSRKTGGYGLGLSICRRIVEAHGGSIEASNNPRRGACFTLRFPTHPGAAVPGAIQPNG